MTTYRTIPLTIKETEAVMWAIGWTGHLDREIVGDHDPLFILRKSYTDAEIVSGCDAIEHNLGEDPSVLKEPLTPCQKDILKLAVERTSWLHSYTHALAHQPQMKKQAHEALRTLAYKLDDLGIEIELIPGINDTP